MPSILIRNKNHLGREVLRALKFFEIQLKRGIKPKDACLQVESLYDKRVYYFFLLALQKNLKK